MSPNWNLCVLLKQDVLPVTQPMNSITLNDGLHRTIWSLTYIRNKELVFRRPRLVVLPVPLDQIEQVHCAKLLGIYLSDTLQFETHLVNCSKYAVRGLTYLTFSVIRVSA